MANGNGEWKLWIFSVGDLISLGGVVALVAVTFSQVSFNGQRIAAIEQHDQKVESQVSHIERILPELYVSKSEYRADLNEIKSALRRIEDKLDDHERLSNGR